MTTQEWETLPEAVQTFMTALDAHDVDRVLATLTHDAVVTDESHDYSRYDEIGGWVATAGAEYNYTTEFIGATLTDEGVDVGQHLEGNFPGGVADLYYRFTLAGTVISRVVIKP